MFQLFLLPFEYLLGLFVGLENVGADAWEAYQVWFSLIWMVGRRECFSNGLDFFFVPCWYLLKIFASSTRKPMFWVLVALPGLIFIDSAAWETRMFQLPFWYLLSFLLVVLENLSSEAWKACQDGFSLIWMLGRLGCFSYLLYVVGTLLLPFALFRWR